MDLLLSGEERVLLVYDRTRLDSPNKRFCMLVVSQVILRFCRDSYTITLKPIDSIVPKSSEAVLYGGRDQLQTLIGFEQLRC